MNAIKLLGTGRHVPSRCLTNDDLSRMVDTSDQWIRERTGIVTRYDEAGCPVGLCRAQKLYYVSTSGGPYDPRFSYQYLRALCAECFGIPETELLMAENLDVDGSDPEAILRDAMSRYGLTPQP